MFEHPYVPSAVVLSMFRMLPLDDMAKHGAKPSHRRHLLKHGIPNAENTINAARIVIAPGHQPPATRRTL